MGYHSDPEVLNTALDWIVWWKQENERLEAELSAATEHSGQLQTLVSTMETRNDMMESKMHYAEQVFSMTKEQLSAAEGNFKQANRVICTYVTFALNLVASLDEEQKEFAFVKRFKELCERWVRCVV